MNEWTNEMSEDAIYAVMERCRMLHNMMLLGETEKAGKRHASSLQADLGRAERSGRIENAARRAGGVPSRTTTYLRRRQARADSAPYRIGLVHPFNPEPRLSVSPICNQRV